MRDRPKYQTTERSPRREAINSELDEHSNRIKELLRADLIMLEEENAILRTKCKKVSELEDKVETILKQNTQLLSENERISKLLHQKKQEFEVLKDKYDVQAAQKMGYATQYEYEKKKLIAELDLLQNELKEVEHIKNTQITEAKSQFQIELHSVKRQNASTLEVYEQEIRKLREQLDKRQYELGDAVNRLKRLSSETQYDIIRLKEEKQKLRNQLAYIEADRKKQLDTVRIKLEANYVDQIESIKKNHLASLNGFQAENIKLKDLLENRNIEIDQTNAKINKQKTVYEESILLLKKENDSLRTKFLDSERLGESEKEILKSKLNKVFESEIEEMRINHQKYIECLQTEINKLEGTIGKKNTEIEQLIKEKTAVRQIFDSEANRHKEEIESLHFKIKDSEAKYNEAIKSSEEKLKEKNKHIDYLDKLNEDQHINFDNETKSLKQIIQHQKSQLDSEKLKFREKEQQAQELIDDLKNENTSIKESANRLKVDSERAIEDLQYELEGVITQLKTKVQSLTSRNNILERQLISLRETIVYKDKEIKSLQDRVKITEDREKKLERENDDLRNKLIKKDQKSNEMLAEQKQRLETTFAFTLDNLKIDHESAIKLQANKHKDQQEKLRRKEDQLTDLLRSYKKMRDQMEGLTEQEANKKQMTLKFPGATADLIATKNLFDVYLKSKVLDICGDVKEKQNVYLKK